MRTFLGEIKQSHKIEEILREGDKAAYWIGPEPDSGARPPGLESQP